MKEEGYVFLCESMLQMKDCLCYGTRRRKAVLMFGTKGFTWSFPVLRTVL